MSPRHFTRAIYGPYYLSNKHYEIPQEPKTKFEVFTYRLFKYSGISRVIDFIKSPDRISRKTEAMPYQANPGDQEIDLKQIRAARKSI